MNFLDIFNEIEKGDYGLTEEMIYKSTSSDADFIPVYGGNQSHTVGERFVAENATRKDGKQIKVFSGEGIIISLDGSAGSMTYKNGERFALNHHAGFITPRESDVVNLEFFSLFYAKHYKEMAVSDGSKTLSLEQIYNESMNLPPIDIQDDIMEMISPLKEKIEALERAENRIVQLMQISLSSNENAVHEAIPISSIVQCMSGNSGLTEEFIYNNLPSSSQVEVLSSSTLESTAMGYIREDAKLPNGKMLKSFFGSSALLVARNGKAGTTRFLPAGKYTINDHAYILSIRSGCPYDVDLQWLSIQYKDAFLQYASSSDNGTWNKSGFMDNVTIDIPAQEEQQRVVAAYNRLLRIRTRISKIKARYEELLSKEIS